MKYVEYITEVSSKLVKFYDPISLKSYVLGADFLDIKNNDLSYKCRSGLQLHVIEISLATFRIEAHNRKMEKYFHIL